MEQVPWCRPSRQHRTPPIRAADARFHDDEGTISQFQELARKEKLFKSALCRSYLIRRKFRGWGVSSHTPPDAGPLSEALYISTLILQNSKILLRRFSGRAGKARVGGAKGKEVQNSPLAGWLAAILSSFSFPLFNCSVSWDGVSRRECCTVLTSNAAPPIRGCPATMIPPLHEFETIQISRKRGPSRFLFIR